MAQIRFSYDSLNSTNPIFSNRKKKKNPKFRSFYIHFIMILLCKCHIWQLALEVILLMTVAYEKFNTTGKNLNMPFLKLLYIKN